MTFTHHPDEISCLDRLIKVSDEGAAMTRSIGGTEPWETHDGDVTAKRYGHLPLKGPADAMATYSQAARPASRTSCSLASRSSRCR